MKVQMKKHQIISVLVIIWLNLYLFNITTIKASETKPTLCIEIHKIQKVDEIEGFLEGAPDWQYFVEVWNGENWDKIDNTLDKSEDPIIVNEIHCFEVTNIDIQIKIRLWDIETIGYPDLADISGCVGGGLDDWGGGPIPRGAQYYGTYNIKTNSLSGDTTYFEAGYYKTSGDYDGSTATDENDANLWFDIGDNYDAPIAEAGPDKTIMVGNTVNFDGSGSTASSGSSIVEYEWDFNNDGIFDTNDKITSHIYTEKGIYTVTLRVTDSIGEQDTNTCKITVTTPPKPTADAGSNQVVYTGEIVYFDSSGSYASTGAILERFQWDFNNDGIFDAEGLNSIYIYDVEGTYTVTLKVTDNFEQTDTDTCKITVKSPPIDCSFTYSPLNPTIQDIVYFYDTSEDAEGSIVSWYWDMGDGTTSTHKDPSHKYNDKGSYSVTLTVTNDNGKSASKTNVITIINIAPTADFTSTPSSPKVGADVQFTDKSTDPEGKTFEYLWDFGDEFTSTVKNPKHQFATAGTKHVKLTVIDDEDASDFVIKSIRIVANVPPSADFSYSPEKQKMNHDVLFTDESTDSDGYVVEWLWDFGDGATSTQETPTHDYDGGGEYAVKLTVTDDNGDSDDIIKMVNIIQTYDLTLRVKDVLGVNIANAEIGVYDNSICCASGSTDSTGELTLEELPEGNYEIQVKVMGATTSTICSLTQTMTEQVQVTLSINTVGITGGIIVIAVVVGFYLKKRRKTSLPVKEEKLEEEAIPKEDVSLKLKKMELERERITEMLKTFKEKFDKGEIDEETYLRLKKKYENELKRLE